MPKILNDEFHIDQSPQEAHHGAKPEPEERVVAHVLTLNPSTVTFADTDKGRKNIKDAEFSKPVGEMPMQMVAEMTTYDAAQIIGALCGGCRHFDQQTWREEYAALKADPDPQIQQELDNYRLQFMVTKDPKIAERHGYKDGTIDVEHIMTNLGACSVFKMLCYQESTCPDGQVPQWEGKTPKLEAEMQKKRELLLQGSAAAAKK